MSNPYVSPGTLNRLKAAVISNSLPQLNVTVQNLAKEMITLTFEGSATAYLPAGAGAVTSPEPYMIARFTAHLLKSQPLSDAYKQQFEQSTLVGDWQIIPDVPPGSGLGVYMISNVALQNVAALNFNGQDAGFVVDFVGTYYINANLWN
jgi:hypothetical protein